MGELVQVNSDALTGIAARFAVQGQTVDEMRVTLVRASQQLRDGWMGLAADAFFHEMETTLLPAVQRLGQALDEAGQAADKLVNLFASADQAAAAPFATAQAAGAPSPSDASSEPAASARPDGSSAPSPLGAPLDASGFSNAGDTGVASPGGGADSGMQTPQSWLAGQGGSPGSGFPGGGGSATDSAFRGLGALQYRPASGGASSTVSGSGPQGPGSLLSYRDAGSVPSEGSRQADYSGPLGIAAATPFLALVGKVLKDRQDAQS